MYPFERFSAPAKTVLTLAQEEAERSRHSYIGTEHLLVALIRADEGSAAGVLRILGVTVEATRAAVEAALGRNERILIQQIIPTSGVKKVIEIAFEEARRRGRNYVGTDHILLALMIEGEGVAAHVLADIGMTIDAVRDAIEREGKSEEAAGPPAPSFPAGSRVLVHDPEPPHRLWEGSVADAGSVTIHVEVRDRPAGPLLEVRPEMVHRMPGPSTFGCRFCAPSQPSN